MEDGGHGTQNQPDRMWVYPHIGAVLTMVGLEEIRVYIARRQNTIAQYNTTRTFMELFWRWSGRRECYTPSSVEEGV